MPSNESPLHLVTAETIEREKVRKQFDECMKMSEVQEAFELLDKLPTHLKYHTKEHTFGERGVVAETILFALAEGASDEVIKQQVIAAAWHDVGFLKHVKGEVLDLEGEAIKLFKGRSAHDRLGEKDSQETISNIKDTTMYFRGKEPYFEMRGSTLGYMLDADLSNFGRDDFFERMNEIAEETDVDIENLKPREGFKPRTDFYAFVITLLENHDWHTEGARKLRKEQKKENLKELRERYEHDLKLIGLENKNTERRAA